jgi:hypothetical protein
MHFGLLSRSNSKEMGAELEVGFAPEADAVAAETPLCRIGRWCRNVTIIASRAMLADPVRSPSPFPRYASLIETFAVSTAVVPPVGLCNRN